MTKVAHRALDPYRWNASTWKTKQQWRSWERVGMKPDLSLEEIKLHWIDQRATDLLVQNAVESVQFDRTIEGASTLTMTLRDPHQNIFSIPKGRARQRIDDLTLPVPVDEGWEVIDMVDVISRAVEVQLDDVYFRLVKVGYNQELQQVALTFEDRIIYWLRRKNGSLRSSRAEVTRAEFILRMLREVHQEKVPFICPELHQRQAIAPIKSSGTSTVDPQGGGGGFGKGRFTVQGGKASPEQKRNMDLVIQTASECKSDKFGKAGKLAIKAAILAVIQESLVKNLKGHTDHDSQGILQIRDSTGGPMGVNNLSIHDSVRAFMLRGFWGKGGAIELAKKNAKKSAGWIAQQCQGSAYPDRYDKWSSEANHWYKAWTGEGKIEGGGGSYVKSYQFARDSKENSWEAITRLAEEVGWRAFITGRAFYFMSEEQLFARRIRHEITPDDAEAVSLTADIDWGKPFNEAVLRVNLGRWDAPPGCVINLNGWGPPDGRWLVVSSSRDWFAPTAELTIRQAGEEKREPASERVDRSDSARAGGGGEITQGKSAEFLRFATLISKHTHAYEWGGGHKPFSQLTTSDDFDCSGSISYAAHKAGMWESSRGPRTSGQFSDWGEAGRGERITVYYNGGHVWALFEPGMGTKVKRFDTSAHGDKHGGGARLRTTSRSHGGFQARHWPGT